MDVSLIPPFLMRLAGLEVNECPKFLARQPTDRHHAIYFPQEELLLPLKLDGIISYLPVCTPDGKLEEEQL